LKSNATFRAIELAAFVGYAFFVSLELPIDSHSIVLGGLFYSGVLFLWYGTIAVWSSIRLGGADSAERIRWGLWWVATFAAGWIFSSVNGRPWMIGPFAGMLASTLFYLGPLSYFRRVNSRANPSESGDKSVLDRSVIGGPREPPHRSPIALSDKNFGKVLGVPPQISSRQGIPKPGKGI